MTEVGCLHPCPNCPNRGPRVGSKGDPNSPFLIIGESPGKLELADTHNPKRPFIGPSGKLLDHATAKSSIEPYYINAIQCNPGNRDEKDEDKVKLAVKTCRENVLKEITRAPRKVILTLGAPALWTATDNTDLKMTFERGKVLQSDLASVGIVPTAHPAFLMSGGRGCTPQQFFRDVEYAIDLLNGKPKKKPPTVNYEIARSYKDLQSWARLFKNYGGVVASDIETSDLQPLKGKILCAGFAITPNYVYIVPEHLLPYIDILFDNDCQFLWHNGQFDVKWLRHENHKNVRIDEDCILLSYALDENSGLHGLEQVSSDWLNSPNWKDVLDQYLPKRHSSYALVPRDILHKYMAYDVGNLYAAFSMLHPRVMADKHLAKLYYRLLIPATNFLSRVEERGLYVDQDRVKNNHNVYAEELGKVAHEVMEFAKLFPNSGYTNKLPGSPKQKAQLLYDDLGIKPYKGKRSTDKKVLEHLSHPVLRPLGRYSKVAKEYGTYVKSLLGFDEKNGIYIPVHIQRDGRVHASLALFKTRTGRLASSDPNIQNIPRNPIIRGQFVPAPGRRFVEVDLNQAELRVLACLSGDPELCRIYLTEGMSLHDEVRAEIWGYPKDWDERLIQEYLRKFGLTVDQRYDEHGKDLLVAEQKMRAKNVNFGVVYGITSAGLAEQSDSTPAEAQIWIDRWFGKFPLAGKAIESFKMAPFKGQTLITPFGRKKRPGVVSQELAVGIQNEFANFPMQSSASDCTLEAGIQLEEQLAKEYDTYAVNLIHDALLYEAPDDDATCVEVAKVVIAKMQEVPKNRGFNKIPFVAEAKHGYRWGSLTDMKLKVAA